METIRVGASVRRRRQALGLSLDALAARCGVSRGMISEVERDGKSPTIRTLAQIAQGLQCAIADLLHDDPAAAPLDLRDPARFERLVDPDTRIVRESVAPRLAARGIDHVRYTFPRGASLLSCPARPGELVSVYVVSGRLRVRLGEHEVTVDAGSSLTYAPDFSTDIENVARGATVALFVLDASRRPSGERAAIV